MARNIIENNDAKDSFKMIRTKARFVDVSPATLFDVLHDVDYKRVWDKHVLDVTEIGHIDDENNVTYFSSENACLIFISHQLLQPFVLCCSSVSNPDEEPGFCCAEFVEIVLGGRGRRIYPHEPLGYSLGLPAKKGTH